MQSLNKILYVEDEPDIQTVARLALETLGGFNMEVCATGREALETVSGFAPDLILLDVMMPGMDGPTTLRELRKLPGCSATPVIFLSAKAQNAEIESLHALGALGVISKPFDPMTLTDQIKEIWGSRLA